MFLKLCRWLHFSFLEMIADYFSLGVVHSSLEQYKEKLQPVLQKKFDCMEAVLKEAKVTEDMPPDGMRKVVVKYNLDAGGITLEDVASYRQFLSSILEISHHLLVLISVLYGSLFLELWIPEELTPRVVPGWVRVRVCFQACTLSVLAYCNTSLQEAISHHCIYDLSAYVGPNYRAP